MRSEIILDDQPRIILPAERTKSSRAHTVPLSSAATRILKPYLANGDAVFNGFAAFSAAKAELDAELGIAPFVLHDLRRSAASWIAELGFAQPHIVEAILNHSRPEVQGVYNRAGYQKEMRSALTQWAEWIEAL